MFGSIIQSSVSRYHLLLGILLVAHVLVSITLLHRVPGLLGDEGSEGENVFSIIDTKEITVQGERSYIGPLIDYLRIPFVITLGYNALALRLVTFVFSVLAFLLTASLTRRYFGDAASLWIVASIFFSPPYVLYQRLGWAITLIPFFIVLLLWLAGRTGLSRSLWAGLAGGVGLSNHFIFLPSLLAVTIPLAGSSVFKPGWWRAWLLALVGFWAGFGMQFALLVLQPEDQGEPVHTIAATAERLLTLPPVLVKTLSGSAYHALYTGQLYPVQITTSILIVLGLGIVAALTASRKRGATALWLGTSLVQLALLALIIDRHAMRYYIPFVLSTWGLAGYGFYSLIDRAIPRLTRVLPLLSLAVAAILLCTTSVTAATYLQTGGSTSTVALHEKRTEPAAAHVDIRPLLTCLASVTELVFAEDIHVYNRLQYLSHARALPWTTSAQDAAWTVSYRAPLQTPTANERCPALVHFRVEPNILD